jgi:hypothetical protein
MQLLAGFGQTYLPPRDDDSHRSAQWDADPPGFLSPPSTLGLRLALVVDPLRLELRRPSGRQADALPLRSRTLEEARRWLSRAVADEGTGESVEVGRPEYEIPEHPVGEGAPFDPPPEGLAELARWYGNLDPLLREVADTVRGAGPVRGWPHHFDLASLITVVRDDVGDPERTVGVGVSPGLADDEDPYLYVNLWPRPDPGDLTEMEAPGRWTSGEWAGAILPATELTELGEGAAQAARARRFLSERLEAARALQLGRS